MTPPDIDPIAGNLSAQIEQAAQASYDELLRLIEEGTDPRKAVEQVLATFNGTYITALSEAFSVVMRQRVTPQSVLAMPVGEVFLSARLYDMVQQTQGEVTAIVRQHAQGLHQARELARQLYDGYDPQGGIKRPLEGTARAYLPKALRELTANPGPRQDLTQLFEQMQQQAGRLKSPALKAGYLEALKAWEQGKGREVLAKRLWVAEREKTRYMADRIAQTELARAYTDKVAGQIMADDSISVVEVRLNPRHPLPDICDLHAKANLWGLGPGLYPKAKAPKPPWHPHCWCRLVTRPDLSAAQAKEREDGAREFLRSLPPAEAARVLGNRQRLDLVLGGADWEKVTQAAVRSEYRLRRVGEVAQSGAMSSNAGAVRATFSSADFELFIKGRVDGERPVAVIPDDLMAALPAGAPLLLLSKATAEKQYREHPDILAEDYRRVQAMLDRGEVFRDREMHLGLLHDQGSWFYAVIKTTKTGKAVFLQSFRRTNISDIERMRARSVVIRAAK
jgi:hypothetical protein